jgi:predicted permease
MTQRSAPWRSNVRWGAFLDALWRDLRYACRSFLRAPLVAVTIVSTVGLGLGLVTAVFTMLNAFVFLVDDVRQPEQLFTLVRRHAAEAEPVTFTRAQYEALLRDTDVFTDGFAATPELDAWIDARRMEGPFVTGNFFQVLGVSAARGRALVPSDDVPGSAPVIVLSQRAWERHFSRDPSVLNRAVLLNGTPVHVVGIMPAGFRGLTVFAPDFWAPLAALGALRRDNEKADGANDLEIVGRLKSGLSAEHAGSLIQAWETRRAATPQVHSSVVPIVLQPKPGTVPQPAEALVMFTPLFFAFGLILMMGSANVANLLLARGIARQREIGVRLAIGASRRRIICQLLIESLLLALVSAVAGFFVSRLVLTGIVYALTSTFPPDLGDIRISIPSSDWRIWLFLIAAALSSTLAFALMPALQTTRVDLVQALRGEVMRNARPGRLRRLLLTLQVAGSALLLICSALFLRSSWDAATAEPGIRTADVVNVAVLNEQRRALILGALSTDPSVVSIAASKESGRATVAQASSGVSTVSCLFVSSEYFGVLGIDLVRGRGFAAPERSSAAGVAIVSESAARQLWPSTDAIGQVLRLEAFRAPDAPREAPPLLRETAVVIGIARDVPGFRFLDGRAGRPVVYLPATTETAGSAFVLRVRDDAERVRHRLVNSMATTDPNMVEVLTFRSLARMESFILAIPFWLTLVLGILALLLTLSGLFSVLSYLVEQRTREIGVRMALGASHRSIRTLVLSQSARPVGLGLLLGASLVLMAGTLLLTTPAAEEIRTTVRLFDPLAYGASLLCIVLACTGAAWVPAMRASRIDPIGALRKE